MSNKKTTKANAAANLNTEATTATEVVTLPNAEFAPTVVTAAEVNNTPAAVAEVPASYTKFMVAGVGTVTLLAPLTLAEAQAKFTGLEVLPIEGKAKGKGFTAEGKPYHGTSTTLSPVSYVHTRVPQLLAEGYTRKQIINTLIEEGVTYYTACTQYQRFMSVSKGKL